MWNIIFYGGKRWVFDLKKLLLIIDRDGTIILNNDFFGRDSDWKEKIEYNSNVISLISYLQTKYKTTKIVITNQTGVARKFFTCQRVEEINNHIDTELLKRGIKIDDWKYCPNADRSYAEHYFIFLI